MPKGEGLVEQAKTIALKILRPPVWISATFVIVSIPAMLYTFFFGHQNTVIGYVTYLVSAYALITFVVRIPSIYAKAFALVKKNEFVGRYITSGSFRAVIGLYRSLAVNLMFAIFKLVMGILYSSFFFGAVAMYYIILCVVRFLLLRHVRKGVGTLEHEYRQYRVVGTMLIAISLALSGVVIQMVHQGQTYQYPGLLIYAVAAYAFYSIIMAIINLVKRNKLKSPALSASKILGFATALVAVLTLQTALLTTFGEGGSFPQLMNALSGSAVCTSIFTMAVFMVVTSSRKVNELEEKGESDSRSE